MGLFIERSVTGAPWRLKIHPGKGILVLRGAVSFPCMLSSQPAPSTLFLHLQLLGPVTIGPLASANFGWEQTKALREQQQSHGHRSQSQGQGQSCLGHPWPRGPQPPCHTYAFTSQHVCRHSLLRAPQPLLCSQEGEHAVNTHKYLMLRERFFAMTQISFPQCPTRTQGD